MLNTLVIAAILLLGTASREAPPVEAGTICLKLEGEPRTALLPVSSGGVLRLNFFHSIYGSSVEERFRVTPEGFQPADLRYSDLRAAEYYGHGSARFEEDRWIVDSPARDLPALVLRVSDESFIRVSLSDRTWLIQKDAALGSHVRLSVTQCPKEASERR
jgi:hypothetical protein